MSRKQSKATRESPGILLREIACFRRHLALSWLTVDPRRDAKSALGRAIAAQPGLFPARLILPIWLCYERHRPNSLWRPYLLSLPSKLDLPIRQLHEQSPPQLDFQMVLRGCFGFSSWKKAELSRLNNSSWLGAASQKDLASVTADHELSMANLCASYPGSEYGNDASSGGFTPKVCAKNVDFVLKTMDFVLKMPLF